MAEKKVILRVPKKKDYDHAPIQLKVSQQDSVLWTSSTCNFTILRVHKDPHAPAKYRKAQAPSHPFYRPFPARAKQGGRVSSGPPKPEAIGQQYKYTYRVGGHTIDPHIIIGG